MALTLTNIKLESEVVPESDENRVLIRQTLYLESSGPTTIIVEQHIDSMTIIEGVRYPLSEGSNRLSLKEMRVINPRIRREDGSPAFYEVAARIFAIGMDPVWVTEPVSFFNLEKEHE